MAFGKDKDKGERSLERDEPMSEEGGLPLSEALDKGDEMIDKAAEAGQVTEEQREAFKEETQQIRETHLPDEPVTTMADQGIDLPEPDVLTPAERGALQDDGPELESIAHPQQETYTLEFPKTPWELRPHETMFAMGVQIMRVPGGWIYETQTPEQSGISQVFVPYIPQANDAGIWK